MAVPVPSISYCVLNCHNLFYQIQNTLAFNRDMCCHLVLCLQMLPFHSITIFYISLSLFLPLSLSLSLSPSLHLTLSHSPSLSLSPSLSDRWRGCVHPVHRPEKERDRVCVACVHKQKVQACSKRSSFSKSVSVRDYIIYIYIYIYISASLPGWSNC